MIVARGLLGIQTNLLKEMQHMVFSLTEAGARLFVTRFFRQFISIGCVTILEGDTIFIFGENESTCPLKSILKIHSPQFYWKVMTQADLGLADAYINGDFSFVDKDSGLLNLIMILIANRDLNSRKSNLAKKRGWWTPVFLTASLASATYYLKHSNEFFGLFMDDTMMYSSAVFKVTIKNFQKNENLRTAQMRKIHLLIEKARIKKNHEVLEIGCGWGTLAIEVVKRTGCKYTVFTLSIEQLKYVEEKVKEAGLQDRITFKL
ncbi:putative cyclopropane-fatty-acyl-phospholipid synthase [Arabidopsis thaliana]